jgi:hypothetical protein
MHFSAQEFFRNLAALNLSGPSLLENVAAGLVVMVLDVVLVVLLLGAILQRREEERWRRTRQGLAYVLLSSMARTMQHFRALLVKKEGRIMLNSDIGLHLLRLQRALNNFNGQTIVHLPSLLPPLSERLSDLTGKISDLEEAVVTMNYHLSRIESSLGAFDPANPSVGRVDPVNFFRGTDNQMHLADAANKSDMNYYVLTVFQIYKRTRDLSVAIRPILNLYASNWNKFPDADKKKAAEDQKFLNKWSAGAIGDEELLEKFGLHLVYYKPTTDELRYN